ncbi:MAG: hypothetical protein JNN29_12605 [Chitinophagaceae bacterium]|nr:hypothetical protein [Chitinophagaceae bacterium]MBN8666888.1 hypothetical protein [Chitinophagales bacterium]
MEDKKLTEKESLDLITQMINKAKDSVHDTGITAIMWGAVIAICSLVRLAEIRYGFRLPFNIYLLTAVAVIPTIIISVREKKARKVKVYGEDFNEYLWISFGIAIFLISLINAKIGADIRPMIAEYKSVTGKESPFNYYEYISSFFLMLYGLPTFVSGACMKFRPMVIGGIFCWVCAVIALYSNGQIDLLLTAVSAILAWLIPGIILEREHRKAKQALKPTHV